VIHTAHLWLFFVLVLGVVVLPGLDMAFVLASALVDGRRSGLAAVAGIVVGGICHVVMAAFGLSVLLAVWPAAFNVMLLAGAAYIAWIGWSLLRAGAAFDGVPATSSRAPVATFRRGLLTALLNPKAYVFMLAIFPQFLRREYGNWWLQVLVLGLIIAATQTMVYGALAIAADRSRDWLGAHPAANAAIGRTVGVVLLIASAWTAWRGWRIA
jgi:threonine/homoserine/homoserine lactone efflux protein